MLLKSQFESPILSLNEKMTAGKRVFESRRECFVGPNFENRLKRRSQIAPVMMEHRRKRTNLGSPSGRVSIGPEMIIKAPAPNSFADRQHFRRSMWVGDTGEHTIGIREMLCEHYGLLIGCRREPHEVVSSID
jgi:hypothetical protein